MFSLIFSLTLVQSYETFKLRSSKFDKLNAFSELAQAQGELSFYGYNALTVDLEIGTPSQEVSLFLGTNLSFLVVPSTDQTSERNYFNASQSTTYKLVNSITIDNQNFGVLGDISTDTVSFNGLAAPDQEFILASISTFGDMNSNGGYLGLGLNQYEFETPNLIETFKKQGSISNSVFAIDTKNEVFTVGGYNESAYVNLQRTDLSVVGNNSGWEFQFDSVSIKGKNVYKRSSKLFLSVEQSGIRAPDEPALEVLLNLMNDKKDCYFENDVCLCRCNENFHEDFDDIDIFVGGKQLKFTPKHYIHYKNSLCTVKITSSESDDWVIGYPLLAEYAAVFDIDQKSVTLFRYDDDSTSKLLYFLIGGIAVAVLIAVAVVIIILVRRKNFIENDQSHGTSSYNRINN